MLLDRYLLRQFFPVFAVSITMFVMLLALIDLFANIVKYLNYEVPLAQMLLVSLFYLPKCIAYALPLSLLFAAAYTLGDLYARNELTTVFASGIPFWRFTIPLVLVGVLISIFSFFFQDILVVPTLRQKNDLGRTLLHQQQQEKNSDIVIKAKNGLLTYSVDYYDVTAVSLNGVNIIEQNEEGEFVALIRAPRAVWTGESWSFSNPLIYEWENGFLTVKPLPPTDAYRELPETFKRNAVEAEALPAMEVAYLVRDLRNAGLPFIGALAEYYHRFSFSAMSFVVLVLSISMGGRFKKNILLMSLFSSLAVAVVFYVMEMISMMMAKTGYIPPIVGAWFPIVFFSVIGVYLLRGAKT